MIDLQFFPTPRWLAKRMWSKFKNRNFVRVLDPEAGNGDLADAMPDRYSGTIIDCIEIDASKHPLLREKGHRVVGLDFLNFEGGACYGHIVMNPPFNEGAKHVLKAWEMLFHGEVCAIINAETLRNPFSAERKLLASIVEDHGDVEYHDGAFKGADVTREANVEIALVHLIKPAECSHDWIGPVIASMSTDKSKEESLELPRELALPNSFVFNQVTAFRMAVKAMREAVRMEAVAQHFAVRIGRTMDDLANNRGEAAAPVGEQIRERLEKEYHELKDRAWASVLRSTEALSKLSRKVQKQAESQFEAIKTLEFNEKNVYGFLLGLVQSQPEMQLDMACDVFDQISKYHDENAVYYRGWKSNTKHRTMGMRIKMTRFVLPGHKVWCNTIDYDSIRMLADFDKVFALLDGKSAPEVSLVSVFDPSKGGRDPNSFSRLCRGERLSSTYFDVRYYRGIGTIHFYPKNKDVVDRLNRIVGRRREWLPPPSEPVSDAFWLQYDRAEKLDREVRDEARQVARAGRVGGYTNWDHPINQFMRNDGDAREAGEAMLAKAMDTVLARHGMLEALEHSRPVEQLLLAA